MRVMTVEVRETAARELRAVLSSRVAMARYCFNVQKKCAIRWRAW